MMDSSLALGRLEVSTRTTVDGGLCGRENEKNFRDGAQPQPNGCAPLSHQVAGHKYGVNQVGILQHPDGTILKQLQPPPRGPREMHFYNMVYAEDCSDPYLLDLQQYLPKYYGPWTSPGAPNDLYLKLEDVSLKFNKPCIMDVKMGQQSYDPYASQEKREQQISKYPLMEEIGFLVLGMRAIELKLFKFVIWIIQREKVLMLVVYGCKMRDMGNGPSSSHIQIYQVTSDSYKTYNQQYGRNLVKDTIKDGLAKFFHNGNGLRKDAVLGSIQKVRKILEWFEGQRQLHFYASSLLFVYEGSPGLGKVMLPEIEVPKKLLSPGSREEPEESSNNNNVREIGSCTHGHMAAAFSQDLSNTYMLHSGVGGQQPYSDTLPEIHSGKKHNGALQEWFSLEKPNTNIVSTQLVWEKNSHEPEVEPSGNEVEVRMIDFAHVFPSKTRDEGYIYGLKSLLYILQQMLRD